MKTFSASILGAAFLCVFQLVVICGYAAATVAPPSDPFYSNWMGTIMPFIRNATLLDLSLPGTHDTMTFDLSTTVSDNANDLTPQVAWLLHELHTELQWLDIGDFMRNQSKTQGLRISEQLDSGIRFIDFRTTYTAPPNSSSTATYAWYNLHFVQSMHLSLAWLEEIREWIVSHPQEILVLWISKHGNNCGTHYTDVPQSALTAFWVQARTIFGSLLFNRTESRPLNETTIGELVERNQRVVVYASDYFNLTGGDSVAYNDCLIDNEFSADSSNATQTVLSSRAAFFESETHIQQRTKPHNMFYLLSMATDPIRRLEDASLLRYFSILLNATNVTDSCADYYNIPGFNSTWCPMHLQDSAQLQNYYNQIALAEVAECTAQVNFSCSMSLPNAIYIDAVDVNGTIRTGTTLYGPGFPSGWSDRGTDGHGLAGFGYVDTFAMVNVRRGCVSAKDAVDVQRCEAMLQLLWARYLTHPLQRWADEDRGRLAHWPLV